MTTLKLVRVDLYRTFRLDQPAESVRSFVEAAHFCAENSTTKVVLVFKDPTGREVTLEILNAEFSNVNCFLVGSDSGRTDGLVEIPTTRPPLSEWT